MKEKQEVRAVQIRFPIGVYRELKKSAKESRRSLNAEVVINLELVIAVREAYNRGKKGE